MIPLILFFQVVDLMSRYEGNEQNWLLTSETLDVLAERIDCLEVEIPRDLFQFSSHSIVEDRPTMTMKQAYCVLVGPPKEKWNRQETPTEGGLVDI